MYLRIPKQCFDQLDVWERIGLFGVAGIGLAGVLGTAAVAWWIALR